MESQELLDSQINSPEMQGNVTNDAANYFQEPLESIEAIFEHGHWWIKVYRSTGDFQDDPETYSVVDTNEGFGYDQI